MNPIVRQATPDALHATGSPPEADLEISLVRTLVLEDDPRARELISDIARQHGHRLIRHASAELAMLEWRGNAQPCPFDLIIVDLALPGNINGFEFVRWVRSDPTNAAASILIITGNRAIADVRDLLLAGADDYQPKPFDAQALDVRLTIAEHRIASARARIKAERRAQEHEQRFRDIFDQSPDALLIVSRDSGRIVKANRSLLGILGVPREEAQGEFLSLLLPTLFENDDARISTEALSHPVTLTDIRHLAPDGSTRFLDITVSGVRWGKDLELLLTIHDATARRELEARRLLSSKVESAGVLALGVAHDFNNILTAIGGSLSMLASHPDLPQDAFELIGGAQNSCKTAGALASQLMHLGRPPKSHPRPIDIRPLIEKAVSFTLHARPSRPLFTFPEKLWQAVADENQLAQIITNLAINADQAMPGGGVVKIGAENVTVQPGSSLPLDPGNYVSVHVSDSGVGIAPENLHRIFDPYFTTKPEDTGLGLAITASILKGAGGYIKVDSTEGEGTTFSLFLPASTSPWATGVSPSPSSSAFREPRVLFMDDDPGIRRVVEKMLTKAGFDVYCASDGAEAIEVFNQSIEFEAPFDILLLDLDIRGGIGGVETIRRIRQRHPEVRALVTSGYIDDAVLENHQEFGFSGVLTKPFNSQKLVSALKHFTAARDHAHA